jgi:hypothetical protein
MTRERAAAVSSGRRGFTFQIRCGFHFVSKLWEKSKAGHHCPIATTLQVSAVIDAFAGSVSVLAVDDGL